MRTRGLLTSLSLLTATLLTAGVASAGVQVRVLEDRGDKVVLRYTLDDFDFEPVAVAGEVRLRVVLGREASTKEVPGAPELPRVCRSVLIPDDGRVSVSVAREHHYDVSNIDIAPARGILSRMVDPAGVPYTFGAAYQRDEFSPGRVVSLRSPHLLRDRRGAVVELYPFQINPVTRTLRVYDDVIVEVRRFAGGGHNVLARSFDRPSRAFGAIHRRHFVNGSFPGLYAPPAEAGKLLVIAADQWLPHVEPLVMHKSSIGIEATAVGVSTIGDDAAHLQSYIQSAYDAGNLAFVLLVGDADQVVTPEASGGASDPSYAKVAGDDDYPDILVGRFSAETAADVDTQVRRTIEYELLPATTQDWFMRATGIASDEGPGDQGEFDDEHVDHIRDELLAAGYTTVDQVYDPGAPLTAVSPRLHQGRGLVNYTGHGWMEGWGTTGFSNAEVAELENDKLPFIFSVACNNGEFNHGTCFGEAWLRAQRAGKPAGAVAVYMSSISQSWDPPMAAQDESNQLLLSGGAVSFGALCFDGSSKMMDDYGQGGVDMFNTWIVFGDPSLRVHGVARPLAMAVEPQGGIQASRDLSHAFSPAMSTYTVRNDGEAPIDFEVSHDSPWIGVAPSQGTLPAHGEIMVSVAFNQVAGALGSGHYEDTLRFINLTDHHGDQARFVSAEVGEPSLQHAWPLDDDPGWTTQGKWAFGEPAGLGGEHGSPDPTAGHTGKNVYGYDLQGDYANGLTEAHLTTEAIDCTQLGQVSVRFWRWLGVGADDHASVSVSTDGVTFAKLWENDGEVADAGWTEQILDLSPLADGHPAVHLRWTMGSTDETARFAGWNVDDVELWGKQLVNCWDADDDGAYDVACGGDDCRDGDEAVYPGLVERCDNGVDDNCDGLTDAEDPECQPAYTTPVLSPDCGCRFVGVGERAWGWAWWLIGAAVVAHSARRRGGKS